MGYNLSMNIFFLSENPVTAARMLVDKHIVKMGLESVQMLCTAHRILDGELVKVENKKHWRLPDHRETHLYKTAHPNHPCSIWVRESSWAYDWLWSHADEIFSIYTQKSGKVHKSQNLMQELSYHPLNMNLNGTRSIHTVPLAMSDDHKMPGDPVASYREMYIFEKEHLHKWTYNLRPDWV